MNSEQFNELRMNVNAVELANREFMKEYHETLFEYLMNGTNNFTKEMLLRIINTFCVIQNKDKIVIFICDRLKERSPANYVPTFPKGYTGWAVDFNGVAYYYKDHTKMIDTQYSWCGETPVTLDTEFDMDDFPHMYEGEAWRKSKIVSQGSETISFKDYKPKFTGSHTAWAIDKTGMAFYFENKPTQDKKEWNGAYAFYDNEFNPTHYKHMWQDGAWERSLRLK